MSIKVRYGTYTNTRAELSLEGGRVVCPPYGSLPTAAPLITQLAKYVDLNA